MTPRRLLGVAAALVLLGSACRTSAEPPPDPTTVRAPSRVIEGLDNVDGVTVALGSVWAVTSNRPDAFSPDPVVASVVRIDPATGAIDNVVRSPTVEPTLAEASGRLWATLADRLIGLDPDGNEVETVPLDTDGPDGLATDNDGSVWVVLTDRSRLIGIDPATGDVVHDLELGPFPVAPLAAFDHVWIPDLIDGTLTIVKPESEPRARTVTVTVTDRPEFLAPVPGLPDGPTGDEIWVTNTDGEVHAVTADPDDLGRVRPIEVDRAINSLVVHRDRAFLLPTWGRSVLALDLATGTVLAEIPVGSIPVRGLAAHDLIWVAGDGDRELLTVIDPESLTVRATFGIGSNTSETTGPRQPVAVDDGVWVANRGDDAIFAVHLDDL